MLTIGVDWQATDINGADALSIAAIAGQDEMLRLLVEKGMDLEKGDELGIRPLMAASQNGRKEAARVLVESGAQIDAGTRVFSTVNDVVSE